MKKVLIWGGAAVAGIVLFKVMRSQGMLPFLDQPLAGGARPVVTPEVAAGLLAGAEGAGEAFGAALLPAGAGGAARLNPHVFAGGISDSIIQATV